MWTVHERVRVSLRHLQAKGMVKSSPGQGSNVRWVLVYRSQCSCTAAPRLRLAELRLMSMMFELEHGNLSEVTTGSSERRRD